MESNNVADYLSRSSPQSIGSTSITVGNAISRASPSSAGASAVQVTSAPSMTTQQSALSATLRRVKTATFSMAAVSFGNATSDSGVMPSGSATMPIGLTRSSSARRATDDRMLERKRSGSSAGIPASPVGMHALAPVSDSEEEGQVISSDEHMSDLPRSGSDLAERKTRILSSPEFRSSAEDSSVGGSVVSSAGPSSGGNARAASVNRARHAALPPSGPAGHALAGVHARDAVGNADMKGGMGNKRRSVGKQLSAMWSKLKWGQSKSTNRMASAPSATALAF